eukprot:TRINITY_DN10298_c0_g3_i2.p1 TRINITY_DN10298_c0_g3~~TRINITY_DN10298_c0_g3_i2.p1  ORF type:complete len:135 (-),score=27.32 TRINITY_DN10298_c0_g3_i2:537-941(-)
MKEGMTLGKQEEQDGEAADKKAKLKKKSLGQKSVQALRNFQSLLKCWQMSCFLQEAPLARNRHTALKIVSILVACLETHVSCADNSDIERECLKFGAVKKVEVFDVSENGNDISLLLSVSVHACARVCMFASIT